MRKVGDAIFRIMATIPLLVLLLVVYLFAGKPIFMLLYGAPALGIALYALITIKEHKGDEDFFYVCAVTPIINAFIFYAFIMLVIRDAISGIASYKRRS